MLKRIFESLSQLLRASPQPACPVCNSDKITFAPLPAFYREIALNYGFAYCGQAEMLSLDTYSCVNCGASDRERLYALWIDEQIKKKLIPKHASLIHFAPEVSLSKRIKELEFFEYKTADLQMQDVDYRVDMMDMPFENGSFDVFICSHVLEHVESDDQAIKELYRITQPGGCGILMAPIILGLTNTLEDSSIKDEAGRWRLYGQGDHLRLYAHDDYVNKICSHGFTVEELGEGHFGESVFRALGLTHTSILYVARKPPLVQV